MKTLFTSPNGRLDRRDDGTSDWPSTDFAEFCDDVADELERLQSANAKLRGACRRIAALCQFPESEARDAIAEAAP